jgi:hypothetical protein
MVSITDSIQWYKDDELIKKHNNIRHHGKDEHFYIETQNDVEGKFIIFLLSPLAMPHVHVIYII